jgi:putative flippase GtrA
MRFSNNFHSLAFLNNFLSKQFMSYILIGICNNALCYLIFFTLVTFGLHYAWATLCVSITGLLINFKLLGRLVFQNEDKTLFVRFVIVYAFIYALNVGLLRLITEIGMDVRLAGALLLAPLAVIAFNLNKLFVFRHKQESVADQSLI